MILRETAVLIVGAGPTGLTLAIDLARRGVSFRLIEAAAEPFAGSRGKGLQPRTLDRVRDVRSPSHTHSPRRIHRHDRLDAHFGICGRADARNLPERYAA